ncbi:hypothetical protein [Polymorphum gilvum]|uniref:Uncharacterized protein n=1 Tax=Polymorphum gilvum (strain LMG 25793 / CGMCC 1.9160 / SL003B-26A1) TaxID=991905 RepID=F2J5N1_POLGS|nr:hypothetical protein [Polymorphum gilvum]ADZ70115.1 hypothetical protein SL003B_1687 [Polymorphum gilvum SL003B-26A1]
MISGRLTMRAAVERNQASGTDAWGNPVAPDFQAIGTLNCFVWSTSSREITDGEKTAMIEDIRALFPLGADIAEDDEIAAVTDRRGTVIVPGRLKVEGPVQHKHSHLEAALKRIG